MGDVSEMPLSVSALVIQAGLLSDFRPACIDVRHVRVGGAFGVQGGEDLVRRTVKAVAQQQRTREEERQENPTRPPVQNRPDDFCPSHLERFIAFHFAVYIPLWGIDRQYTPTTNCCQAPVRCFRSGKVRGPGHSYPRVGDFLQPGYLFKVLTGGVYGG